MLKSLNIFKTKNGKKLPISRKGSTRTSISRRSKEFKKSRFVRDKESRLITCAWYSNSNSYPEDITSALQRLTLNKAEACKTDDVSQFLHNQIIGKDEIFKGPFGRRKCVYVDTTASGKSLKLIEDFIRHKVLPFYANTHTTTSYTSLMMTTYREEARRCVRESVGGSDKDAVLFCGSGSTGAIHKLIHCLNIRKNEKPIVIVGPYEHHSNLLPWRETGAKMINIPEDEWGSLDDKVLKQKLKLITSKKKNKNRRIFGCFSAGSNVTGITSDDVKITKLLHEFGGLCFWDYAAAAPHVKVEMNPREIETTTNGCSQEKGEACKDALYFSGHKFPGGPQTTGVLVVKQFVFKNPVPHNSGGGTVFFVTPERHAYLQDKEEAEEGGTPAIIESIRLGLVMSLNRNIGAANIICRETYFTKKAISVWSKIPGLIILGNTETMRLPIISFVIQHLESGFQLHQNFVVALLNDLFGVQCRGGCMCAGPYAQVLLGINLKLAEEFERVLSSEVCVKYNDRFASPSYFEMIYRPGFTRVSFPFEASYEEIDFVIEAVQLVARFGWKLLTRYKVCPRTGEFKYYYPPSIENKSPQKQTSFHSFNMSLPQTWRLSVNRSGRNTIRKARPTNIEPAEEFSEILKLATEIFDSIKFSSEKLCVKPLEPKLNVEARHLRWFMLPSDAAHYLWTGDSPKKGRKDNTSSPIIIDTARYRPLSESGSRDQVRTFSKKSVPYQLQRWWTSSPSFENTKIRTS